MVNANVNLHNSQQPIRVLTEEGFTEVISFWWQIWAGAKSWMWFKSPYTSSCTAHPQVVWDFFGELKSSKLKLKEGNHWMLMSGWFPTWLAFASKRLQMNVTMWAEIALWPCLEKWYSAYIISQSPNWWSLLYCSLGICVDNFTTQMTEKYSKAMCYYTFHQKFWGVIQWIYSVNFPSKVHQIKRKSRLSHN